jgi:hypothetical protein
MPVVLGVSALLGIHGHLAVHGQGHVGQRLVEGLFARALVAGEIVASGTWKQNINMLLLQNKLHILSFSPTKKTVRTFVNIHNCIGPYLALAGYLETASLITITRLYMA